VTITAPPVTGPPSVTPVAPRRIPKGVRPRDLRLSDVGLLVASAVSALALVWLVYFQVLPLSGAFGFLLLWYGTFLATYWSVTAQTIDRKTANDRVFSAVVVTGAAVVVGLLVYIVAFIVAKAVPHLSASLLTHDSAHFTPTDPSTLQTSGVLQAIIGTLEQTALAVVMGVPIAIVTAVFLNEVGGRGTRFVRTVVTAMSGMPALVAGIFIYSMFIINHWLGFSGFAASLALFVILLPWVTRTTEEVLRVVPSGLREASLALGAPEWRTVWSVVLPTARSGVITAVLLGTAIAVGETAPLIFTAFGSNDINTNAFHAPQGALALTVFQDVRQAQQVFITFAYEAAFVLLVFVVILFVLARILGRPRTGSRRRRGGSGEDVLARSFLPIPIEAPPTEPVPPVGGPPLDEGGRW
jgi:phosphate transport system permease protein